MRVLLLALALTPTAQAQWQLQPSNTTASLRGIHAVTDQIAWASGTVRHTTDRDAEPKAPPTAIPSNT